MNSEKTFTRYRENLTKIIAFLDFVYYTTNELYVEFHYSLIIVVDDATPSNKKFDSISNSHST